MPRLPKQERVISGASRQPPIVLLTAHDTRRVAVAASVEPRTVRQYLIGERVRPMCAARIVGALHKLGLARLVIDLPNPAIPAASGAGRRASDEEE